MIALLMPHRKPRALDWALAAMAFASGFVLLLPGDSLALSGAYEPLLDRAPEEFWGAVLVLVAALRGAALIVNGRLPAGSPILRFVGAALTAAVWSQFLTGALDVGARLQIVFPQSAIYVVLIGCEIVTIVRASLDYMRARQCRDAG